MAAHPVPRQVENDPWLQFLLRIVRTRKQNNTKHVKTEVSVQATWSSSDQKEIGFIFIIAGIASIVAGGPVWIGAALIVAGLVKQ